MTFSRLSALILGFSLALSPLAANAATESAQLTLQQPASQNEYIIDGAAWTCSGTSCHAATVADMPALRSCKRVVAVTGAVSRFTWRGKVLSEAQIAECNTKAQSSGTK